MTGSSGPNRLPNLASRLGEKSEFFMRGVQRDTVICPFLESTLFNADSFFVLQTITLDPVGQ